jgi:hypothetical protein
MEKPDSIINHYKQLTTEELLSIAQKPEEITPETISILQNELINRDEFEVAYNLRSQAPTVEKPLSELTETEIAEVVRERVNLGESIESIQIDLKSQGVDIFNFMNQEAQILEEKYNYIVSLRKEGLDEEEITQRVQDEFDIDENENEVLKIELKQKGTRNIKIGYTLVFVSIILALLFTILVPLPLLWPVLLFVSGLGLISKGYQQVK